VVIFLSREGYLLICIKENKLRIKFAGNLQVIFTSSTNFSHKIGIILCCVSICKADWKFTMFNTRNGQVIIFLIFKQIVYKDNLKSLHYLLCKTDCILT